MKKILFSTMLLFATSLFSFAQENRPNYQDIQSGLVAPRMSINRATTITPSEILYWVGEGSNEMIAVFYWCQEANIGLAYGYRWNGTKTIGDMLQEIADTDNERFFLDINSEGWVLQYTYADETYTEYIEDEGWLMYYFEGNSDYPSLNSQIYNAAVFVMQEAGDCDFSSTEIIPVPNPNATPPIEYFDGIVGSEGCKAIYWENPTILGWATTCEITRGYQNIASPTVLASYGEEQNVIGAATASTTNVVSLGDGGSAVLTFDYIISDGEGYDFAVFENSLNDVFLELAFVEVSSDGVNFVRFPATSYTQTTTQIADAGSIDATNINNLAGKYRAGWGVPFDLAELADSANLDVNHITHIKIIDVVGSIDPQYATYDAFGHIINDPYPTAFASGGFDLSGVAVLNGEIINAIQNNNADITFSIFPNPCSDFINIKHSLPEKITLYDTFGRILIQENSNSHIKIDMKNYPSGIYFIKIGNEISKFVKK
jgi:hypothetical protein